MPSSVTFIILIIAPGFVLGQNLNVIPELFRSYVNEYPELQTLNILGNVSDVLFTSAKNEASIKTGTYLYQSSYDFVIVGSGPAGCVLANRLSSNPEWTVLLIEAGQPETIIQDIPLATTLSSSSKYVRNYFFERNSGACLNIVDRECPCRTGVALGGSSVVNNFIYTRGHPADFDKWKEMGNEGWAYEDVLPYFEKIERQTDRHKDPLDGPTGVLNIEHPQYTTGLLPVYLQAGQELGQPVIDYSDRATTLGIGIVKGTTSKGRRVSAASAYLQPIYQDRPNLHIITNARATKVFVDPETLTAHSVQYKSDGVRTVVKASKEIILSAGPIGSAHLLMLSGIGPKEVLQKANIPLVHELPVGQAFHVNVAVHGPHFLVNSTGLSLHIKRLGLASFLQFNSGRGPLTSFTGVEALSFDKTPFGDTKTDQPDFELQFISAGLQSDLGMGFRKAIQLKASVYESIFQPIENPQQDVWSVKVTNLHSKAKGNLQLIDNDINTDPLLEYPFFDDRDVKTIVYGIRKSLEYARTKAFKSFGAQLYEEPLPSCSHIEIDSDEYWECFARHLTIVVPQMMATNKMGPSSDPESVVDDQLKVHGIKNLRVADTSIIPTTMSGHLQAVSYLIGEKAAHLLREHWNQDVNDNSMKHLPRSDE